MAKWALYHDFDPFKCEVVREAIKAGAIADGEVICGDIKELTAGDVRRFRQFHAFCGGAFWSLALRQAGWDDSRPVWTGSCPCPSFSAAGKGEGFADPRHLWPEWARLIRECRPRVVIGEQVAAAIGHGWLDLVCGDLEAEGYAVAAAVLGAHSVGAPHIRQRLYFVADAGYADGADIQPGESETEAGRRIDSASRPRHDCQDGLLVNPASGGLRIDGSAPGRGGHADGADGPFGMGDTGREGLAQCCGDRGVSGGSFEDTAREATERGGVHSGELGDASIHGRGARWIAETGARDSSPIGSGYRFDLDSPSTTEQSGNLRPGPLNGFWRDADWIGCRDGRWRPVEPGTFPLAHGYPARVGILRLAGDAICVPCAAEFIKAYIETERQ